jgi:PST family polysaccharide transporter
MSFATSCVLDEQSNDGSLAVKDDLRQKTIAGVGWTTLAQIGRQGLQFVISIVLARLLVPQDFGLVGMITIFTNFATLFSELGFTGALIQRPTIEERHYSSIFWLNLFMGVVLTILLMLAAPFIAAIYDEPRLTLLTMLIAMNFSIGSLNIVQRAILSRAMNFRALALIEISAVLAAGLIAVILALAGCGVWSLAWQMLAISAFMAMIMWRVANWRPRFLFEWSAVRELLGFSANLLGFNVLNYWARNADNFLVGKFIGSAALGLYARAYSIMLLPISQITTVLSRVMFPAFSKIQSDTARVKRIYLRAIAMIAVITFPMMIGLWVVAQSFVLTLYGPKWVQMISVVQILCIVGMAQSLATTVGWIYQSQGRTDWMFRWGIFAGTMGIASFVLGVYIGTIEAVAWCYAVVNALLLYWNFAIPGKLIDMTFADVVRAVVGIFGCAFGMGVVVWGLGRTLPLGWPHWTYLAIQAPVGILTYLGLISLFRIEAYRELRSYAKHWPDTFRDLRFTLRRTKRL